MQILHAPRVFVAHSSLPLRVLPIPASNPPISPPPIRRLPRRTSLSSHGVLCAPFPCCGVMLRAVILEHLGVIENNLAKRIQIRVRETQSETALVSKLCYRHSCSIVRLYIGKQKNWRNWMNPYMLVGGEPKARAKQKTNTMSLAHTMPDSPHKLCLRLR